MTDTRCCSSMPATIPTGVEAADLFKALSDPARVTIIDMLASLESGGDLCVCDFEGPLGLSQATVSHHLRKLLDAGLVVRERRGTWSHYTLDRRRFGHLRHLLDRIEA